MASSRLSWKNSRRWNSTAETSRIFKNIRGWRDNWGDWLLYYRFDRSQSEMDDIYDEGIGVGRFYQEPLQLDTMHTTHIEGRNQNGQFGFYFNDELTATLSYETFILTGMTDADVSTSQYLNDRILYDNKIFRVTQIAIEGQIQRRDIIVQITATQVKPDELTNDPQFKKWSA